MNILKRYGLSRPRQSVAEAFIPGELLKRSKRKPITKEIST